MPELCDISIKTLYGVGDARAAVYAGAGVRSVEDLLYYFPRAYENRGNIRPLFETPADEKSAVLLTVGSAAHVAKIKRGMSLLKFRAFDESGSCSVTFFNQDYLRDKFPLGSVFRFWGKVERVGNGFSMSSPAYEPYTAEIPLPDLTAVYRIPERLTSKQITKDMKSALSLASDKLKDPLPEEIRRENGLCTLAFALRNIHMPTDYPSLTAAKRRLIFDEFFMFAAGLSSAEKKARIHDGIPCPNNDISPLLRLLPYRLTNAQSRVINEIRADMESDIPMRRIVVGDVGCGKTICAAAAMLIAVQSGRQAALMAPTEILARQHFTELSSLFADLNIGCELLIGSTGAAQKRKIKEALAADDPARRLSVVIGTHALLSDGVSFAAPGVIVTDEQHRFGVNQRATLAEKSSRAHVLVMSATPIPRSLALVMYGDLDVSKIDTMPPGRRRVDTYVVNEGHRERVDNFIRKQTAGGGQTYIVCPAIEESETGEAGEIGISDIRSLTDAPEPKPPLKAAESYAAALRERMPDMKIGLIHGRLKSAEKEKIMGAFTAGEIDVLVSTTVIEVGVNVPNACLMIVENAERFGLSQLHQLRGRVGRGMRKSYCILISDATGESAKKRLATMKTSYDGYVIAETDLAMRGPGDFLSGETEGTIRQSGGIRFRLASMCDDAELMGAAFTAAKSLTDSCPTLSDYPLLRRALDKIFEGTSADIRAC